MRMKIHPQAGALADGKPKSSLALNNEEFTRIKAIFLSWTEPENLDAQLKAEDQDLILARGKIRILIQDVEMSEGHLQAMSEKLFGRPFQVLANPQLMKVEESAREAYLHGLAKRMFGIRFEYCSFRQYQGIMAALVKQKQRQDNRAAEPVLT